MSSGIAVTDFVWKPGENDAEYIHLLEEALERQKTITNKAVSKVKLLSARPGVRYCNECPERKDFCSRAEN